MHYRLRPLPRPPVPRRARWIGTKVAGATQALAGSSDAVSTTTGALTVAHSLIGSSAAVSTTTGALAVAHSLVASSDAVSSTLGSLTGVIRPLTATSAGQSATTGALTVAHSLIGTSTAVSTTTATLIRAQWLWPTTASANGRYIRDQNGNPWMMHGDAAWSLLVGVSFTDAKTFLDDRASRGINALHVNLVEHFFATAAPANFNGDSPFTGTAFQSSLGSAYWTNIDNIVEYAKLNGITVFAFPAYLGFNHGTDGWWSELAAASNAQVQSYGSTIGTRYKNQPNIIWTVGGDYIPTATEIDRYDHLMIGVQSSGDTHLATAHLQRGNDGATSFNSFSWFSIDAVYTGTPTCITDSATAYNRTTVRPTFAIEPHYQFRGSPYTLASTRLEQWQVLLVGGIGGHFTGNESVWSFGYNTGIASNADYAWASHLADQNITDAGTVKTLFDNIGGTTWRDLVPDLSDTFLTSGEGSGGATQAAASYSTEVGLVYLPAARSITVNMAVFAGHATVNVRWFDPTNGSYTSVGAFSTSGSQTISHPGNNAAGDPDWVLRVDAAGVAEAMDGSSSGVSATSGALTVAHALIASSDATTTVTGALTVAHALAATSTAVSATTGDLVVAHALVATSTAVSATTGALVTGGAGALNGQVDAVSTVTGALSVGHSLAGTSTAVSATAVALALAIHLSATSSAQSATIGFFASGLTIVPPLRTVAVLDGRRTTEADNDGRRSTSQ